MLTGASTISMIMGRAAAYGTWRALTSSRLWTVLMGVTLLRWFVLVAFCKRGMHRTHECAAIVGFVISALYTGRSQGRMYHSGHVKIFRRARSTKS